MMERARKRDGEIWRERRERERDREIGKRERDIYIERERAPCGSFAFHMFKHRTS